ncbi:MAG: N-acetyl-gamma-glutamyl-phosphate reductase [Treponema sp.]|nr:N-acetyl-gamma-glutamyl-phosphate reductase [Treponema sp.]
MIAGIIGASGYAGAELVRLLAGHPECAGFKLASVSFEGGRIEQVYPNFLKKVSAILVKPEAVIEGAGAVFAALPSGVGEPFAAACAEKGIPFIDISADFRFGDDGETFRAWYGRDYLYPELRKYSVYGLPELNRRRIRELAASGPVIVGNPGCYPTGASLGAYPALAKGLYGGGSDPAPVIVDAASGVTGGGREPSRSFHFPECSDSLAPYKVGAHRHTPEISRAFRAMGGRDIPLIFTPHLAPMNRGILSTIYIPLGPEWRVPGASAGAPRPPSGEIEAMTGRIRELYGDFYRDEPFVRVLPQGVTASTNRVRGSNYCDISVHMDQGGTTLIAASAIDNMVKGAAGQAIQNLNILMGFEESAGLGMIPALF